MAEEVKEAVKETVKEEGTFKMKKKKPRKLTKKDKPIKVDLSKKEIKEDAVPEPSTESVDVQELPSNGQEVGETHVEEQTTTPTSEEKQVDKEEVTVIQDITNEEPTKVEEVVNTTKEQPQEVFQTNLPENVEKLVEFMNETGGTIDDYVRLNADYSNVDGVALLKEYYKQTKPHLNSEEVNFLMDDKFSYDEDIDEERDIRKKKLALKEEVAEARNFLDGLKSKYYEEIKLRPGVTQEQQKALDFFNRYNKEREVAKEQHEAFKNTTKAYFNNDFKGFEFELGDKGFRYGVNNASDVANEQSDISTFVKKFLNEDGSVKDHRGYHKAIYAARNADTIAQHFYEQGKVDAIKDINAKSKNINTEVRSTAPGEVFVGGFKVKAISGADSSKLKIKKRKFNT